MRHAITCARLHTHLKFLEHAFYCMPKTDKNLSGQAVFHMPERPANVLKKALDTSRCFKQMLPETQTLFPRHQWMLLDGLIGNHREMSKCSKVILVLNN